MTRMHTKKVEGFTLQAITENGVVTAIKVLDNNGKPISWGFTDRVYQSHVKLMQNLVNRGEV